MKENIITGSLTGLISYIVGLPWELLIIWTILMIIDIITGNIKAAKENNWSSKEMKIGLLKKCVEISVMFSILLIQRVCIINGINIPVGSVVVGIFCFKEFGSIVENYTQMGGELPKSIMNWFKVTKKQIDGEDKE
jgi:polar amino acid transport system substrate-binding protein